MTDKKVRGLIIAAAMLLLLAGGILYYVFYKQGMSNNAAGSYVNYDIDNYVEISPVVFNEYNDIYSSINVSKVKIKNLDNKLTINFIEKQDEIINYIKEYYDDLKLSEQYSSNNTVTSTIKAQINNTVLSVFYRVDFNLDDNVFNEGIKSYVISYNIDLGTNKILTNDDLLLKYNYSKKSIADKLFNDDVLIAKGQVVIDKDTHISLVRNDIERKKEKYVERITNEFDNIMVMYIDNKSLVLVYNSKNLKEIFFDNKFDTNIKFKYLQ